VLVVEDEWLVRSYLVELLQETGLADVVAAVETIAEAEQALVARATVPVDAVFVDVQLTGRGDEQGLEWVRRASREPDAPVFVLATAFSQHSLEAFDLGVADYLVKPFTDDRVGECVRRLRRRIAPLPRAQAQGPSRIVARRGRALVFVELPEVLACEAADRLTYLHSARGRFDLDLTLSAIEASFGRTLWRVHRNWLVNPGRILELEREAGETSILVGSASGAKSDGLRVPVAKERATEIRERLLVGATGVRRF
jgi:DNA-binding LytR/AlgR family response regulator